MNIKQAKSLKHGDILHYTGKNQCGEGNTVVRVRVSGAPKTWKRNPNRVRVPVKYGLYENSAITEDNLNDFHLETDCPLFKQVENSWKAREFSVIEDNQDPGTIDDGETE